MVLDDLESVVDQLCGTDPAALSDGETIQKLHRCLARLEAATTRASAAFDAGGQWQADGARSASAWLARRCGLLDGSAPDAPGASAAPPERGRGGLVGRRGG